MVLSFKEKWNIFAMHTWLLMSSFGIMFACFSFIEDLGAFSEIKKEMPWLKGILAIIVGIFYYLIIGLPHLDGTKTR